MVSLLLDEDIHKSAAGQLRLRGYDAIHVTEIGRAGLSDEEQLLFAHSANRILISFNVRDYVRLHQSFTLSKKTHSGIILSKQISIGEFIKKLARELQTRDSFENLIYFL
jgi:predicted nuclease of predicted toxin-antitoxin system